ncbi:hypothetical protein PVK06_010933 [Gossypium arboreum]|uniref:Reverse transcriptase domain-containing protein n=1 Tax=Gossypium arboreum TaxID=29729 RepID=A0ABR0Q7N1_GOSAR|nr:hypothetical protein PVK06_010933 [Gossypium arboreum]
MHTKRGKKSWMTVKVDSEKAYDRLRWDFIEDTLLDVGFPLTLVNVAMECITSVSMQIVWNGRLSNEFVPNRGIRQGCPLSLDIFALCMERLEIEKIARSFIWGKIDSRKKMSLERLLTNVERCKRGASTDPSCPICGRAEESCTQFLRDYYQAREWTMRKRRENCRWSPPSTGSYKINVDGAHNPSSGFASSTAVAKYEHGLMKELLLEPCVFHLAPVKVVDRI